MVNFEQYRLDGPHHERQRDERKRHTHTPSGVLQVQADWAVFPVEGQQYQAGHNRGQRERQIDDHVDEPFSREVVTYQHPGDQQAENHVEHGDARGDGQRHPE